MSICRRVAFLVCPDLREEVAALQDGNTKCVLENSRLLDCLATLPLPLPLPDEAVAWREAVETIREFFDDASHAELADPNETLDPSDADVALDVILMNLHYLLGRNASPPPVSGDVERLREQLVIAKRALDECADDFSTPPGTVMDAARSIQNEFARRMEVAGTALAALTDDYGALK